MPSLDTDSCLFGAWLAELPGAQNALNIGGGTKEV